MNQKEWKKTERMQAGWFQLQRRAESHAGVFTGIGKAKPKKPREITEQQARQSTRAKRARADRAQKKVAS